MKLKLFVAIAAFIVPRLDAQTGGKGCPAFSAQTRARLITYVQKKYRMPETARLQVSEVETVSGSCFRKLRFISADPKGRFRTDLFLSPDQRFLTAQLLDVRTDPAEEERKQERAVAAALTSGPFASAGASTAPVTLTVFSDFECPFCARFAEMLKRDVLPVSGADTRVVFRHYPLPNHPWARAASNAAACAQTQSNQAFWGLHDYIFEHQQEFTAGNVESKLIAHSRGLKNFDQPSFVTCVKTKAMEAAVARDIELGDQSGVRGTPTVFVNGRRLSNVAGSEQILTLIREISADANTRAAAKPR